MTAAGTTGRYLFAVARDLNESSLDGVPGLRGAPLQVVTHRDLKALVCTVDLDEFGEESLARNLEDLTWLEEVARAHHDVIFWAASTSLVAPMRLVTICANDESVRSRIEEIYQDLSSALDRVEGRSEWSVKVYAIHDTTPAGTEVRDEPEAAGAGAAYLQRKRAHAEQRRSAGEASVRLAEEIHNDLAAVAAASRQLPPQDPRLTGRPEPMILNGAYLVAQEEGEAFRALVHRVDESHPAATVEAQGPWPPYSFATLG